MAPSGIIAFSPCSAAELTAAPEVPPPNANELDYALLRLEFSGRTSRGWMDLKRDAEKPGADAPLLIVQHPAAAPLKPRHGYRSRDRGKVRRAAASLPHQYRPWLFRSALSGHGLEPRLRSIIWATRRWDLPCSIRGVPIGDPG